MMARQSPKDVTYTPVTLCDVTTPQFKEVITGGNLSWPLVHSKWLLGIISYTEGDPGSHGSFEGLPIQVKLSAFSWYHCQIEDTTVQNWNVIVSTTEKIIESVNIYP